MYLIRPFRGRRTKRIIGMQIGIFYPHPISGSLGSIRRVVEIAKRLRANLESAVTIYSPYESTTKEYGGLTVKSVPSFLSSLGTSNITYNVAKKAYYSKLASKLFLQSFFRGSSNFLTGGLEKILLRDRIDLLQVEQDVSLPGCLNAGRKFGIPIVADLHNILTEELVSAGVIKKDDKIYNALQERLGNLINQSDAIVVVSKDMADYLRKNYLTQSSRIILTPPGADPSSQVMPFEKPKRVVFSGTVTYREHVDLFVRGIGHMRNKNLASFHITGKGDKVGASKRLAKKIQVDLNWFWFHDQLSFFKFLASSYLGILTSKSDDARRLGTPIKMMDYMSMGLPIVANKVGGWSGLIVDEGIGILTQDSPEDFGEAIDHLVSDETLRNKLSLNSVKCREKYSWDNTTRSLVSAYAKLKTNSNISSRHSQFDKLYLSQS